jgi:hypothetical protein
MVDVEVLVKENRLILLLQNSIFYTRWLKGRPGLFKIPIIDAVHSDNYL